MNPGDSAKVSIRFFKQSKKSKPVYFFPVKFFRRWILAVGALWGSVLLLEGISTRPIAAQESSSQTIISVTSITIPTHPADNALIYQLNPTYNMYYAQLDRKRYDPYRLENRTYNLITLENDYLKLTLLPELGGRIYQAIFKPSGNNVFYQNPVIKPTRWGPPEMGWWLAVGGMEWGLPVEEHGYEWGVPWSYQITDLPDGAMVEVWDTTADNRVRANVAVTLPDDAAVFQVSPTIENPTDTPVDLKFWLNAMVSPGPTNRVSGNLRFIWPADQVTVHSTGDPRLPEIWQAVDWPVYNDVDYSRLEYWHEWYGFFQWPQASGNFQAVYDEGFDEGVVRVYNSNVTQGAKFFGHGFGVQATLPDYYTDDDSSYIEMHGGLAPTFAETHRLEAQSSVSWTEYWYPVFDLKSLTWANEHVALYLETAGDEAQLHVALTQPADKVRVLVLHRATNEVLYQNSLLEILPSQPYHSAQFLLSGLNLEEVAVLIYQDDTLLGAYQYDEGAVPTLTPAATATPTSKPTATDGPPTPTPSPTSTPVPTSTPTWTATPSPTFTPLPTSTYTPTPSPTFSPTPTPTATFFPPPTATSSPTSTPTAVPTFTPTATPTVALDWLGRIRRVVPIAGGASVVRIWVEDRVGLPVTIKSDLDRWSWQATGFSGSKPEYGPDALEFAPLPPIPYTLSIPDLPAQFSFELPPSSVTEVVFTQSLPPIVLPTPSTTPTPTPEPPVATPQVTPSPTATVTPNPTPTFTPTPEPTSTVIPGWQVRVAENTTVPGNWFAVIRVSVEERIGMPVRITIVSDEEDPWSVTCLTGTKPEYGPYFCEFSPLIPAEYIISLDEFDISTTVEMTRGGVAVVIFEEN